MARTLRQTSDLRPKSAPTSPHELVCENSKRVPAGQQNYEKLNAIVNELIDSRTELVSKNNDLVKQARETGALLGMVVHDLRNPISGVLSASEFLLDDAGATLDADQLAMVRAIESSSFFMLRLIDDVLNISSFGVGNLILHREMTDLKALVKRNFAVNEPLAWHKQIRLGLSVDGPSPRVNVDVAHFGKALDNLFVSAIQASRSGSTIEVRVNAGEDSAIICIRDIGSGIPHHDAAGGFVPARGSRKKHSSNETTVGLRLSIVERIIQAHGGSVELNSQPGGGVNYTVTLPAAVKSDKFRVRSARTVDGRGARGSAHA